MDLQMQNIFGGLEKFGLGEVVEKNQVIFEEEIKSDEPIEKKQIKSFNIDDYIYLKTYTCPVCDKEFKSYAVRHGKVRMEAIEYDLRPIHTPIEPLFYDVIMCENCGYTAVNESFNKINRVQIEKIKTEISPNFKPIPYPKEMTVDMAIDRYKLALLNCVVKEGKDGERAYICMKLTWLYRIKGDESKNERQFAELTLKGFTIALSKEIPPIMGIAESAVMYLIAAFSTFLGNQQTALKILSGLIASSSTSSRLKNRARDLKQSINAFKGKGI